MANIEQDLQAIMDARYGRDVRQSIHDAIYDINEVNEANISTVQTIANTAQGYANNASDSANTAQQAVTDAQAQVTLATTQAENANDSAEDSEAWAVGQRAGVDVPSTDPTYENNAKYWQERANYWYQQAQAIAESFSGALRPMGTVTFANLPSLAEATAGDMYNVSDEFTTTSDFKEGAGHVIPLGSNVYKTTDSKWDVLAGSPVTGIKGDSESSYRKGNVNITKANIGLGNVDNESLGSADISAIGDGSVKGAIDTLNTNLTTKLNKNGEGLLVMGGATSTTTPAINWQRTNREIRSALSSTGDFQIFDYTSGQIKYIFQSSVNNVNTFFGTAKKVEGLNFISTAANLNLTIGKINGLDGLILGGESTDHYGFEIGMQWAAVGTLWFRAKINNTWNSWYKVTGTV